MSETEWDELDRLRAIGWASSTAAQRRRRAELLDKADAE